jgi:hypothetical protein
MKHKLTVAINNKWRKRRLNAKKLLTNILCDSNNFDFLFEISAN